ncbi:hypothetical protein [Deinococcus apachensis]|uniref:hypothetical protein n=1 Tax=Deinococcus apachensis TaxID=309886 RepID=UPI00038022E2|nr:hypothetical protein [Deinococcus apachensis]
MPILILGGAAPAPEGVERSLTTTARTRRGVERSLQTWAGTRREAVERELSVTARTLVPTEYTPPPDPEPQDGMEVLTGGPLLETRSTVTGLPGTVLTWEYIHNGQHEELTVTVTGRHGLASPTATVEAVGEFEHADGVRGVLDRLPRRTFQQMGQEPEVDEGADTTTFRFRNSRDQQLRGVRLPELLPWKLNPTPPAKGGNCADRPRQRQRVSDLVRQVMLANVDPYFSLDDDPLKDGAEWVEEERDFSTEGLSPQQLWDQTYGLLGMVLHVRPLGEGIRLVGCWPQPRAVAASSAAPFPAWTTSRTDRREMLHTPTRLTVRGAPFVTELTYPTFMEWVGDDPARDEISRALGPDSEWFETDRSDTGTVRRGFRKSRGQMVAEVEITTGDVIAEETVDGEKVSVPFYGVLLGHTETTTTYDPECADRPLLQRTLNRTYGYTPFTRTGSVVIAGPGLYTAPQAGELVADEEVVTTYRYSPQGYLIGKTTTTRKLGSLEQQDAEEEPAKRGKLTAKEYLTTVVTEAWMLLGSGRWRHSTSTSTQSLVPVYDLESGDAIRTATVTRSLPPVIEYTDQAPPSYRCPTDCEQHVQDETGVVLDTGDAGFAEEEEVSVPFLDPARLTGIGEALVEQRWWRVVSTVELAYPFGTPPGFPWGGENGFVREVRLSGDASGVTSSVTVARADLTLNPRMARVSGLKLDPRRGSSVMLAGRPGGARVRLVMGWDPDTNLPEAEDAFVTFRTGFPPTPGDEIEWQLVNGTREATNAR